MGSTQGTPKRIPVTIYNEAIVKLNRTMIDEYDFDFIHECSKRRHEIFDPYIIIISAKPKNDVIDTKYRYNNNISIINAQSHEEIKKSLARLAKTINASNMFDGVIIVPLLIVETNGIYYDICNKPRYPDKLINDIIHRLNDKKLYIHWNNAIINSPIANIHTDEKISNNDVYKLLSKVDIMLAKVESLKSHTKYKEMVARNEPLLDTELLALIYYTDDWSACNKMKQSHRKLTNVKKWKHLYYHATNGISKIYRVFHYKNENQAKISKLYHGSTIESFDGLSQEQLFLKTFWSFTSKFQIAKNRFGSGSIWIIDNVFEAIYSGQLKAVDISWISKYKEESEWIVLPSTFYNWHQVTQQERNKNHWNVRIKVKLYRTHSFISNIDALCIHADNALSSKQPDYKEFGYEEYHMIKEWFITKVKLARQDNIKYFKLFVNNGCHLFSMIVLIETEQDLEKMGIRQVFHQKQILQAIHKLKKQMSSTI